MQETDINAVMDRAMEMMEEERWNDAVTLYAPLVSIVTADMPGRYAEIHTNLGNAYYNLKSYPEAIAMLHNALSVQEDCEACYLLGRAAFAVRDFEKAVDAFFRALKVDAGYHDTSVWLARVLCNMNRYQEAAEAIEKYLDHDPDDRNALVIYGGALMTLSRQDEAQVVYQKILSIDPHHVNAHINLGTIYLEWHRYAPAIKHLERAVEIAPDLAYAHFQLGTTYATIGDLASASRCHKILQSLDEEMSKVLGADIGEASLKRLTDPQDPLGQAMQNALGHMQASRETLAQAHYADGISFTRAEQWAEAAHAFEQAIEYAPEFAAIYALLAKPYQQLGRNEDAIAVALKAISMSDAPEAVAVALPTLAVASFSLKRFEACVDAWRRYLQYQPESFEAWRGIALACWELDRFEEALEGFEKSYAMRPDRLNLLRMKALCLSMLERPEEAVTVDEELLAGNPNDYDGLCDYGSVLGQSGRHIEGIEQLKKAIRIAPNEPKAYHDLGLVYASSGDFEQASQQADHLANLDKDAEAELRKSIENVRASA